MARFLDVAILAASLTGTAFAAAPPAVADPACTCRGPGGKRVELGGTMCLATPAGPRLARCVMDVNILSWQTLDAPCVVSSTPVPGGAHRLAALARSLADPDARP